MHDERTVRMTTKDARRVMIVQRVLDRQLRQRQAAELLDCSVRQVRRWVGRIRAEGPAGIVHRLRGRSSNRRLSPRLKARVLARYRTRYAGFGPTLACEKLAGERLRLNRETLRQWLREAGLWSRQRRAGPPHVWRERKAARGEMVQLDGSHHAWLEGRGPRLVLMAYIDDATNHVFARFYDYEGTQPAFASFAAYVLRYGLPQSVYLDRHTTYRSPGRRTVADELAGRSRPQSQFERALSQLGVQVIPAYSPQAKGRVERLFRTCQDRLVKELRLAGVTTRDGANRVLQAYLPRHNRQFELAPRLAADLHRPAPAPRQLQRILAVHATRTVRPDQTFQYQGRWYLLANGRRLRQVTVVEQLDGQRLVLHGEQVVAAREIAAPPRLAAPVERARRRAVSIPAADHPWRYGWQVPEADISTLQESGHF